MMNKSTDSTASGSSKSQASDKKVFVTDPYPIIRYLNMALAAGMLFFALFNIFSIFSPDMDTTIFISFMFSIFQM